jgi:hypothetical protein
MSDRQLNIMLPDDLPYEDWVNYVFDHPILEPQWWWQDEESGYFQYWPGERNEPERVLAYLTRLFQEAGGLLGRFTNWQIDQGLHYLVSNACSDHMFVLSNAELPWSARRACVDAMITLYRDLMSTVYKHTLEELNRLDLQVEHPSSSCFMWWDIIPLYARMPVPNADLIDDAVINVFEHVILMDSEACQESVLHGLGHWYCGLLKRTEPIVRRFLERKGLSSEIRAYAENAAIGHVQ